MSSAAIPVPRPIPDVDHRSGGGFVAGVFIVLFGFLLASSPARNPDLWGYLAAGRDLSQGRAPLSPELAAAPGWLFDLACYAIHAVGGGAGLVLAKAAL